MTVADVAAAAGRNQVPLGIAYMVGSTVMFAGGNAVVKWQLASYPLGEVAFGRTLFAFLTVAAIVLPRAGLAVLRTNRYREHLQRGLSQFGSMSCWFLAVSALSLGSATAIGFAAPLFTTLLSIVILKEKVGIHRWSALIVGFVGVLIITHPGAGTLTYGALFALGSAVFISTVAIAIRRMSMTESPETLTLARSTGAAITSSRIWSRTCAKAGAEFAASRAVKSRSERTVIFRFLSGTCWRWIASSGRRR